MTECITADLSVAEHSTAVISLLNEYAMDILGGGERLSDYTQQHLDLECNWNMILDFFY